MPLADALTETRLHPEVSGALLGGRNRLRWLLDTVVAQDRADWSAVEAPARRAGLDPSVVATAYLGAIGWSGSRIQAASAPTGFATS